MTTRTGMRLLAQLYTAFLLGALFLPMGTAPVAFNGLDKLVHVVLYGILASLWLIAWGRDQRLRVLRLTFLVAVATEVIQLFLPWRSFDWFDMVANLMGVLLAIRIIGRPAVLASTSGTDDHKANSAKAAT